MPGGGGGEDKRWKKARCAGVGEDPGWVHANRVLLRVRAAGVTWTNVG